MPDHSGHYLTSGALDLDEKWIKGAGQDEGICEMSLTYLLDGEKGASRLFSFLSSYNLKLIKSTTALLSLTTYSSILFNSEII